MAIRRSLFLYVIFITSKADSVVAAIVSCMVFWAGLWNLDHTFTGFSSGDALFADSRKEQYISNNLFAKF